MLNIWLTFPTANSDAADAITSEWIALGYRTMLLIDQGQRKPRADHVIELDGDYPGFPAAANQLCRRCVEAGADIVVVGGDDIHPHPSATAGDIAARFIRHFPNLFGVLQPTGDAFGALDPKSRIKAAVSPWIGAGFIRRAYGGRGPYHAGYRHLWADTELWYAAESMGVLAQDQSIVQYHAHHTRGHADHLPAGKRQAINAAEGNDQALFKARRAAGFPGLQ